MKSVGVIGGLGPETTAEFYLQVIFQCQKQNAAQRPSIVIASVPLPFAVERDLLATNTGIERYIPYLVEEAKRLERSGVDFLVMPCNSLHVFIEQIREAVSIPVLSIVEETIAYLRRNDVSTVGLISTSATVANRVYETQLQKSGIAFVAPSDQQRVQMDEIIQRLVSGDHRAEDRQAIMAVADDLADQGVDSVALACTDLQLLKPESQKTTVFDTMKILAEATADEILAI